MSDLDRNFKGGELKHIADGKELDSAVNLSQLLKYCPTGV